MPGEPNGPRAYRYRNPVRRCSNIDVGSRRQLAHVYCGAIVVQIQTLPIFPRASVQNIPVGVLWGLFIDDGNGPSCKSKGKHERQKHLEKSASAHPVKRVDRNTPREIRSFYDRKDVP